MTDRVVQSGIVVALALRAKGAAVSGRPRGVEHNVDEVDSWTLGYWSRE